MVHMFTKIGGAVFGVGFLIILLTGIVGVAIPPFTLGTGWVVQDQYVNGHSELDITAVSQVSHPFFTLCEVKITITSDSSYQCYLALVYESRDGLISSDIGFSGEISGAALEIQTYTFSTMISNAASARGYSLLIRVQNSLGSQIQVTRTQASITFSMFALIFPGIITLIGGVLIIFGFMKGRGAPSIKQPKPVSGWEPTLQWGGSSGSTSRRPKMAIKSSDKKAPQPKKTVVKKVTPAGGSQTSCKFCGKQVPTTAFFCPHCYGKLR